MPRSSQVSRRSFLGTAAALAATTVAGESVAAASPGRARVPRLSRATFTTVGSTNSRRASARAVELMRQGVDTLDAAVEGVKIQELDPSDQSVGYGGLPNAEGVVQLDASCVHGPTNRAGAVAALEGIKTASEIARLVLRYTTHIMLVGEGAKRFALSYGFKDEDLLTPESREAWLRWRANRNASDDWVDIPDGERLRIRPTGTINLNVLNEAGDLSSVTTTSGLAWKIPGRAGDSPIVGAGQYCDNAIGAAGSTGLGEVNIMVCGAFLTVEGMRRGLSPTDACLETLRRAVALAPAHLLDAQRRPTFQLNFYAINKRGVTGGAAIYPSNYCTHDGVEPKIVDCAHLFENPQ